MSIRPLPRAEWRSYFDAFSKDKAEAGRVEYASVRVLSSEDGDQPVADWAPLLGLTYDPKDDLLEVQMQGLDHLVAHPTSIFVDEEDGELARFEVAREDGSQEVVELS